MLSQEVGHFPSASTVFVIVHFLCYLRVLCVLVGLGKAFWATRIGGLQRGASTPTTGFLETHLAGEGEERREASMSSAHRSSGRDAGEEKPKMEYVPDHTTFGSSERFSTPPKEFTNRPHAYRGFTSLLDRSHGRAVSPIGTFTTGMRSTLGGVADTSTSGNSFLFAADKSEAPFSATPVGLFDVPLKKHSRGVKRTERRFRELRDDASPGPIYKPAIGIGMPMPTVKFSRAARFPQAPPTGAGPSFTTTMSSNSSHANNNNNLYSGSGTSPGRESRPSSRCTFGLRHEMPSSHVGPMGVPILGPQDTVAQLPKYSGKFPLAGREPAGRSRDTSLTPGPGQFLKSTFVSDQPRWSFGRRLPPSRSIAPGPGAYRIDKFKPYGKPNSETFSRVGHGVVTGLPGLDSPGPSLYAPKVV